MTINDAIETIKCNYPTSGYYLLREALDTAIYSLEKQIPKKPIAYHVRLFEDDTMAYDCPNCRHYFTVLRPDADDAVKRNSFCHICGQAIDWSEEE